MLILLTRLTLISAVPLVQDRLICQVFRVGKSPFCLTLPLSHFCSSFYLYFLKARKCQLSWATVQIFIKSCTFDGNQLPYKVQCCLCLSQNLQVKEKAFEKRLTDMKVQQEDAQRRHDDQHVQDMIASRQRQDKRLELQRSRIQDLAKVSPIPSPLTCRHTSSATTDSSTLLGNNAFCLRGDFWLRRVICIT